MRRLRLVAVVLLVRAVRDVDLHDTGRRAACTSAAPMRSRAAYNEGANWVGVLFAAYNGFAALAALLIPLMARRLGLRVRHLVNLALGRPGTVSVMYALPRSGTGCRCR